MTFQFTAYPVPVPPCYISGRFKDIYGDYEHPGTDLAGALNTEIRWTGNQAAKRLYHTPGDGWGDGSFGTCCIVDVTGTPYWVIYAHMPDSDYKAGDWAPVQPGELVGHIGLTGKTTGPHVHWGMSSEQGPSFDPMRVVDAQGIARITNPKLHEPLDFLQAATPPAPVYVPTNAEILASLNNLNAAVIDLRDDYIAHGHRTAGPTPGGNS